MKSKSPPPTGIDFPEDLLADIAAALARAGSDSPASVVHLACTSRSVAKLVLPLAYRHLFVASITSLPQLHATLTARPDLAQCVLSLTVGADFATRDQFTMLAATIETYCKVRPSASVVSIRQVLKRCGQDLMRKLPMAWLTQIATVCPNLRSIDLSAMPCMGAASSSFLVGFLDLAGILRKRNGVFHSAESTPITGVLVTNVSAATNELQLVTRIDWGNKQVDTMNKALGSITYTQCPITPWSDLSSKSAAEQAKWTIRDAFLSATESIPLPYQSSSGVSREQYSWEMAGVRLGKDHVFPLRKRGQIVGGVTLCTMVAAKVQGELEALCVNADRQLTGLELSGVQSGFSSYDQMIKVNLAGFASLPKHPFRAVSKLILSQAMYLDPDISGAVFKNIAQGMPNLVDIEIFGLATAMDMPLMFLDHLIRRTSGRPLTHLRVSGYLDKAFKYPLSTAQFATSLQPKLDAIPRTALSTTKPSWGHLHSLTLELEQSDSNPRNLLDDLATCAIHPGLLHGITHLKLDHVKLYVLPPHLSSPSSPSFVPLAYLHRFPSARDRALLGLEHTSLRNLTHLHLSVLAVLSAMPPQRGTYSVHRLPYFLPGAPALRHLELSATSPPTHAIVHAQVEHILSKYPRIAHARISGTHLTLANIQSLVRVFLAAPRILSPTPSLVDLALGNTAIARDNDAFGQWYSRPHIAYFPRAPASGPFTQPGVDADTATRYGWQEMADNFVACSTCGSLVQFDLAPIPFTKHVRKVNERNESRFVNAGVDRSPVGKCPGCAPGWFWRVGAEGVVKRKEGEREREREVGCGIMWKKGVGGDDVDGF